MDAELPNNKNVSRRERARTLYNSLPPTVWCSALKQHVTINTRGFRHLFFNGKGIRRGPADLRKRLSLLPYIVEILTNATIVNYKENTAVSIRFWALTYFIHKDTVGMVRVVLRQDGDGKLIFWSIMAIRNK